MRLLLPRPKHRLVRLTVVAAFGVIFAVAMAPASAYDWWCEDSYTFIKSDPKGLWSSDPQNDGGVVRAWGTWPGWNEAFHVCFVYSAGKFLGNAFRSAASRLYVSFERSGGLRIRPTSHSVSLDEIFNRIYLYRTSYGIAYAISPKYFSLGGGHGRPAYLSAFGDDDIVRADADWVGWNEAFIFPDNE